MTDMLTTAQMARLVKTTSRNLLFRAAARGVVPAMDLSKIKLWRRTQAHLLGPGKIGRPRKQAAGAQR